MKNNNLKLTEIEVSISSEEIEAAKKDKAQWDKINKKELKQDDKKEKVEPMTLKAFVREQVEGGKELPFDLFGVYIANKTKITNNK